MLSHLMDIERGKALSVGRHDVEHTVNSLLATRWKRDAQAIDMENLRLKDAIISAKTQVPLHNVTYNRRLRDRMSYERNPLTPNN